MKWIKINKKIYEKSTMPKNDKLNNSEIEIFKSSNNIKVVDILTKVKFENSKKLQKFHGNQLKILFQ